MWTFTYDSGHRLLTSLNPDQHGLPSPTPMTNVYDSSGRVTSQSDLVGRTTTFDYSSISGATKITGPAGRRGTLDHYNTSGQLTQSTTGYGTSAAASTCYTYDPSTERWWSVTSPRGYVTTNSYDSHGNLLTTTDQLGRTTTNTYDGLNDVLTSQDPAQVTTTMTYDGQGNTAHVEDAAAVGNRLNPGYKNHDLHPRRPESSG